ncbi:hypothetical protein D3C87_1743440 [compost metagenome]
MGQGRGQQAQLDFARYLQFVLVPFTRRRFLKQLTNVQYQSVRHVQKRGCEATRLIVVPVWQIADDFGYRLRPRQILFGQLQRITRQLVERPGELGGKQPGQDEGKHQGQCQRKPLATD